MAEEKKTLVQQYEEQLSKLQINTEKIKPADRTGTGRYAAAYEQLYNEIRKNAGLYAFCYVFGALYVPNTPEGIEMLKKGMEIIRENGKELLQAIFSFSFEKIHALLDNIRKYIIDKFWVPLETAILNSGKEMPETIFVESILNIC